MMSGIAKCCAGNPTRGLDDTPGVSILLHYSGFLFRTQPILSDFSQIVGRAARYFMRLRMFELGEHCIDALGLLNTFLRRNQSAWPGICAAEVETTE